MDAASIEEINKVRLSLGMQPLPVPGQQREASEESGDNSNDEDAPSTLESREARAYDNFNKVRQDAEAKKKREERAAAVKRAREMALRENVLEGKGLADDQDGGDDVDTKAWLKGQKKRQAKLEKARKREEEKAAAEAAAAAAARQTAKELAGLKVGHDAEAFFDGGEQVLTLKDTGVLEDEDEGDELENVELREQEKLHDKLDLKRKKPLYDPIEDAESGILAQYDEEIDGKKKKGFSLNSVGVSTDIDDILAAPIQKRKYQTVDLDELGDAPAPTSDYLDASEVKIKKPKKKKTKSTRQRPADDDDILFSADTVAGDADETMDIDAGANPFTKKRKVIDETFVDDEDLQTSLARQRKEALRQKKRMRPEDIAKQLREEATQSPEAENGDGEDQKGGLVIDEISGFVEMLGEVDRETRSRKKTAATAAAAAANAVTAMDVESSEDEKMEDGVEVKEEPVEDAGGVPELSATGVEEEQSVSQGMGATLDLLRSRGLLQDQSGAELNDQLRKKQFFLAELRRRMALYDEEVRKQREQDRASGYFQKMSTKEREEWSRRQNSQRDQHQARVLDALYREAYTPTVDLKYIDEHGRRLDSKEAFRHLSHMFHGKGSGKGKTDKKLRKIEAEKKKEAESILDVSQNLGMSSAASHQIKKRREAGVRLA